MTLILFIALIVLGYLAATGRTTDSRDVSYSLRPTRKPVAGELGATDQLSVGGR